MELTGPFRYRVSILPPTSGALFEISDAQGRSKFATPATSSLPKIYIVTAKDEQAPIYVGITKQSIRTRLRLGWTATGESGYHGYHWRHHYPEVALDLWCDVSPEGQDAMLEVETIEAEIVFLIRQMGQWPLHQTEIHFHPSDRRHRDAAKAIVSRYVKQG